MKVKHIIISVIFVVSVFNSCQNEIPFDIKENSPKLVVNAMIDINFENNFIFVSKTGKDSTGSVNDAMINIYINDELREQLTQFMEPDTVFYEPGANYYLNYDYNPSDKKYKTNLRFNPGDKVKIEVFADNNKYHAWAEDIVPKPLEIEKIDTMTFTDYSQYYINNSKIRLKTTFTDYPNEKNFYRLVVVQKNNYQIRAIEEDAEGNIIYNENEETKCNEETKYMDTRLDPILNNGRVSTDDDIFPQPENIFAVFDDKQLNTAYTMTTSFDRPDSNSFYKYSLFDSAIERVAVEFKVHLISITEMQYYYLKALNTVYDINYDEYLSMPVSFPSNVEGGVGFVGFSAGTHKTFSIPDIIPFGGGYGGIFPY